MIKARVQQERTHTHACTHTRMHTCTHTRRDTHAHPCVNPRTGPRPLHGTKTTAADATSCLRAPGAERPWARGFREEDNAGLSATLKGRWGKTGFACRSRENGAASLCGLAPDTGHSLNGTVAMRPPRTAGELCDAEGTVRANVSRGPPRGGRPQTRSSSSKALWASRTPAGRGLVLPQIWPRLLAATWCGTAPRLTRQGPGCGGGVGGTGSLCGRVRGAEQVSGNLGPYRTSVAVCAFALQDRVGTYWTPGTTVRQESV